jgi:hypothetical protein
MLYVVEEVAKEQCSVYTLPKSVFIQFVGGYVSRRGTIALCLKGMQPNPEM